MKGPSHFESMHWMEEHEDVNVQQNYQQLTTTATITDCACGSAQ